ncbi:MAG: hypothetical protein AB9907_18025 [Flexilinea sp.]
MNRTIIIAYFVLLCNRNAYMYNERKTTYTQACEGWRNHSTRLLLTVDALRCEVNLE